jgi:hypothetical protein
MKLRHWLIAGLSTASLGVVGFVVAPRLLMRAATEKPAAAATFVTRPANGPDLRSQMNQAVQTPTRDQLTPGSFENGAAFNQSSAQTDNNVVSNSTLAQPPEQQLSTSDALNTATPPPAQVSQESTKGLQNTASSNINPAQSQNTSAIPPGQFQLQIKENDIASMIYNGLYAGTAPEYRPSIQGVSVQLQGGKGRITVALLPKYLPEHFAKNLPGVTKDTPTIYLGGEVGLSLSNNTVSPEIYSLSLGSLRIPAPFIKAMVKHQVQQHVRQMTHLDSGQEAIFDQLEIENGAVSIRGHVQ